MNNKIIYWIIAAFFVFVSTLFSIFIYPFIDAWTGTYQFRWIIMTFGGALLIASTVFYFKYKKSKWPSIIMFPISLLIVLSSIIHVSRYSDNTLYLFDNYIKSWCALYTKTGFKLIDFPREGNGYSKLKIGYDSYSEKYLIYSYRENSRYEGNCTEFTLRTIIYDKEGNYIGQLDKKNYSFDRDYYNTSDIENSIDEYIENALYDYGIDLL